MTSIDIFLKALSNRMDTHRGKFICNTYTKPCKFPAYKCMTIEVWNVDGEQKTLLSKEEITERMVDEEEKQNISQQLMIKSIENVLKWYGI